MLVRHLAGLAEQAVDRLAPQSAEPIEKRLGTLRPCDHVRKDNADDNQRAELKDCNAHNSASQDKPL